MNMHESEESASYLDATFFIDSDADSIVEFTKEKTADGRDPVECAVRLFYAVRDGIEYDVMDGLKLDRDRFRASAVLARRSGFCIPKAVLLAAVCRSAGIPARLRFMDIRNHLSGTEIREMMGTDIFVYHGLAELFLNEKWVKATPAFDAKLCSRHGLRPVEFDGVHDAVFHESDLKGDRHMEYIRDHGHFQDLPFERIAGGICRAYPGMY